MTITKQLHTSATHKAGIDPACPACQRALKFCRQTDSGYADCMAAGIDEATWRAALAEVRAERDARERHDGPDRARDFWGQRA